VTENKENRREISKLMTQLSSHTTSIEILQHDVDSRRRCTSCTAAASLPSPLTSSSTISKMDTWVRQGEAWRSDIEGQLAEIASQGKTVNRIIAENKVPFLASASPSHSLTHDGMDRKLFRNASLAMTWKLSETAYMSVWPTLLFSDCL
jgi:hypothetical protein